MKQDITYNVIDISEPVESFQSKQSQLDPIDYNLLINKPDSFLTYYSKWDGSDGNLTVTWTETLYRDMYYDNLTINSWAYLYTNGYSLCVKWQLVNNGTIDHSGVNWNNASLYTGGAGWAAVNQWTLWVNYWGKKWGNGGIWPLTPHENWLAWDNANPSYSNTNGVVGASGWDFYWTLLNNGWAGGTATRWVNYNVYLNIAQALAQLSMPTRNYNVLYNGLPSSGWSGGWQHNGNNTAGGWAGGSGSNGGIIVIHCWAYYGTWVIRAKWGNGWNGANWQDTWWWPWAWWGGGWSGWSGWVIFFTYTGWNAPNTDVSGWSGGNPWANTGWSWALAEWWKTGASGVAIIINK